MAIKHLKTAEFEAAVEAAPLAMVDFWASWCGQRGRGAGAGPGLRGHEHPHGGVSEERPGVRP